ncbi:MAG: cytochrome c-type biogenesis protein CcmH [Dehalococcoidia bacterium]
MLRWILPSALILALVLTAGLFAGSTRPLSVRGDEPPTVHQVASELMCQCGCAMTVAACQESMECSVADGMVEEIRREIDAGKSKREIVDGFASIYGEAVLAMPRKSGFGLTAWVTPLFAVAAGGVVVAVLIWAWARRRSAPPGAELPASPSDDLYLYEERVDEELRFLE